ncbi:hypothetical protein [Anaeromusa sp.]|uniref:portal protein n=1 Tax=Anaeromusa sp. TaxID=1872520 RepID=UPI0026348A12|nr:hypothetical protein [Anaeromusa sp.]MDD3157016.1 hypothetical protein [Anaeromusa sp.]
MLSNHPPMTPEQQMMLQRTQGMVPQAPGQMTQQLPQAPPMQPGGPPVPPQPAQGQLQQPPGPPPQQGGPPQQGMANPDDHQQDEQTPQISLDELPPEQLDVIMRQFKKDRDEANRFYKTDIEPKLIKRQAIVDAKKEHFRDKFPKLSELSEWCSQDVKSTVNWIMPSLMDVFCGTQAPVDIQGVMGEDDEPAKRQQTVIQYQVERKNSLFMFLYGILNEGLRNNMGAAKVYWKQEKSRIPFAVLADQQKLLELIAVEAAGQIELQEIQPLTPEGDLFSLHFDKIKLKKNQPVLENLSPSELRFTSEGKKLSECRFVAHRAIVNGDYLAKKEQDGIFQNVEEALEKAGNVRYTELELRNNPSLRRYGNQYKDDKALRQIELYEAYMTCDYNGDGILENVVLWAVGDVPLRVQLNDYEIPPFFLFSPLVDPHRIVGDDSVPELIEQLQDLKTALMRQIIINVAKNNDPQTFIDVAKVDINAVLAGENYIPVNNGDPRAAVFPVAVNQLSPATFNLLEVVQGEVESRTGVTRYNQGLDASSLNKTASGISAIMGAANKRMLLIARTFAETTWLPIIRFLISLNQKYMDREQLIRLLNQDVSPEMHEIQGDFDLIVNVGNGAGTNEMKIQMLQQLMASIMPTLTQIGITTPENWYKLAQELFETMGMKNTKDLLTDPQEVQQQKAQQQQQAMQQQLQAEQQKFQQELTLEQVKQQPNGNITWKDAPFFIQMAMAARAGFIPQEVADAAIQQAIKQYMVVMQQQQPMAPAQPMQPMGGVPIGQQGQGPANPATPPGGPGGVMPNLAGGSPGMAG